MPRRYDASRRREGAQQTRDRILQAALKLHWKGITEYEPLAQAAGCSLPTVRKHFPTKEALFHSCTRTFAESLTMPDLTALAAIADPSQRLEESVSELCRIHEAMFGYAWLSAKLRNESRTLDQEMQAYEGLIDAIAGIITVDQSSKATVVRGLLDFLTYRALRLPGELSPEEARHELTAILRPLVVSGDPVHNPTSQRESHGHQ